MDNPKLMEVAQGGQNLLTPSLPGLHVCWILKMLLTIARAK